MTHTASAWVRCRRGAFTVAIVVGASNELPFPNVDRGDTMADAWGAKTGYFGDQGVVLDNVTSDEDAGEYGPTFRAMACSDANETGDGTSGGGTSASSDEWSRISVTVRPSRAAREVQVAVVFGMPEGVDAPSGRNDVGAAPTPHAFAADIDDVTLEAVSSVSGRSEAPDSQTRAANVGGSVGGGGGDDASGGTSCAAAATATSHPCRDAPQEMVYRIREEGGAPVTYVQYHAMTRLAFESVQCRMPDPAGRAPRFYYYSIHALFN